MMNTRHVVPTRSARAIAIACSAAVACATLLAACADKDFTPPRGAFSPRIELQLTTTASQIAGFGPKYLELLVGYSRRPQSQTDDDTVQLLASKSVDFALGTQTVTVPVDLALCMADPNRSGPKDGCVLYVAGLLTDKRFAADSEGSIFDAFDAKLFGPFEAAPGRVPTIPPMDLSATRFGVIRWEGDEALRLGGDATPLSPTGPVVGVASGAGTPVLMTPTAGYVFTQNPGTQFPFQGPYAQVAILQNGAWRRVSATTAPLAFSGSGIGTFVDVTAISATEVYLAHSASGLYRYDGTAIARVSAVTDSVHSVASVTTAAAAKYVIAGAPGGIVWIGNTQTWQRYSLGTPQRIDGVCITGPSEAFATSSLSGGVWRFDGTAWTSVQAPNTAGKMGLQCPAPGQAFLLVSGGPAYKWSGTGWTALPTSGLPTGRLVAWGVVSATEIYAASDSGSTDRVFYRFDGTKWGEVGRKRFTQGQQLIQGYRLWADPRGGAAYYATPFGRVERVTPTAITVLSYQPALRDVSMSSATSAFAVGWHLFLARWNGVNWTVDAPPQNTQTARALHGVWSDGPTNAWAVGTGSTILRYNGTAWSVVSDTAHPVASADAYNAVWGAGADVWIAGNTMVRCKSPTACASEATGGAGTLYSVWGSSSTNVFAVGAGGRIVRYNGTSWSAMASPTSRTLVRVAGSGPSDVWAVGDSVLVHYNGTAWSTFPMTGDLQHLRSVALYPQQTLFQIGLWVRGPNEAYLGAENGAIARWDGKAWNEMGWGGRYRRRILGIAGAPGGCALAVTEGLSDVPSPTLWRGVGSTGCYSTPMTGPPSWP